MELAFIPIAAILLLFAGSGTSVRFGQPAYASSVLQRWFSMDDGNDRNKDTSPLRKTRARPSLPGVAAQEAWLVSEVGRRALAAAHLLSRTCFHTRFGVPSAAYSATAPPLA